MTGELESGVRRPATDAAALVARWVLGGYFVYTGLSKALWHDPEAFLTQVHEYGVVSNPFLLNSIGGALPWFEVICGLLLVAGVAVRGTALVILGMLAPFTLLVLRRALAIAAAQHLAFCAVKFNCGCGVGAVFICHKLPENIALMLAAAWLVVRKSGLLCWRFGIWNPADRTRNPEP